MRVTAPVLTSLLLCACASSPPVRFFVLDFVAPAAGASRAPGPPLQIVSVHMPAELDRRQMVREDAPNQLIVSEHNRWGAALPDMTRRVLSQDLSARLTPGRLVLPEQPPPPGSHTIAVDVVQFGLGADGNVALQGSWSIMADGADYAAGTYPFELRARGVPANYAEQARMMSILLGQLADAMTRGLGGSSQHVW
jgi:uncharacterized protein